LQPTRFDRPCINQHPDRKCDPAILANWFIG
jgi:hypothetical protein